ncbi:MAG: leucyl aminopeptidase [Candidatus Latescibacteria bacterium]|nr:leucyl aminopeptidase [Candidatus Latescibacterota bacterium]
MTVEAKLGRVGADAADAVIVGLFEGERLPDGRATAMENALKGLLSDVLDIGDFKGKKGDTLLLYPRGAAPPKRVLLVGLGPRERFTLDIARQAAGKAGRALLDLGVTRLMTTVHGLGITGLSPDACAQATVEGTLLGTYRFSEFKTDNGQNGKRLDRLTVVYSHRGRARAIQAGVETGRIVADSTLLARDLSNAPGNALTPRGLADAASKMAKRAHLACQVFGKKEIEKIGMGALLAVNRGSEEPPRFIVLEHGQPSGKQGTIVFVGKGITFDSGGISIKPGDRMEEMKHDMSGAAAVVGAMQAIGALNLPAHVVGLIPATENLPDGRAYKPGDIIPTLAGKTIEVINTDAEGRVVLADALAYAARYKPAAVIDLATLTGACVVALGHHATGIMGNDEVVMARVQRAGNATGERVWPLPLWDEYHEQIKSEVADVKNTGGRPGGAITGAAFLQKFVDYPWVHLDIAGTAYTDREQPYCPKGATGAGVRLLVQFAKDWGK